MKKLFNSFYSIKILKTFTGIVFVSSLLACGTVSVLKQAKEYQKNENYSELAKLEIDCSADKDGCNQLYLLKGDGCFRLAMLSASNDQKESHLNCAVENIFKGIDATKDWESIDIDRAQFYENGLEASRQRTDFPNGQPYEAILAKRASEYLDIGPQRAGAHYYTARAVAYRLSLTPNDCDQWQSLKSEVNARARQFANDLTFGLPFRGLERSVNSQTQRACN